MTSPFYPGFSYYTWTDFWGAGQTRRRIGEALAPLGIDKIQDIRNPLDVTPVANDASFAEVARAVLEDPGVDCAVISPLPLSGALQTLPAGEGHREDMAGEGSVGKRLIEISKATDKPFVINIDSGADYDPLCAMLEEAGIPVFRDCDAAVRFMRRWVGINLGPKPREAITGPQGKIVDCN